MERIARREERSDEAARPKPQTIDTQPLIYIMTKRLIFFVALLFLAQVGAQLHAQEKAKDFEVRIHTFGDPDKLNPLTSTSADASYIQQQLYSSLLEYDPTTLKFVPQLAKSLPKISLLTTGEYAGGMSMEFEIRAEAVWDNGKPITADDVVFTLKALKNPKVDAGSQRPYVAFVHDIVVNAKNRKKFTVYSREVYFLAESSFGGLYIMPEYAYDEKQIMRKFSFKELNANDGYDLIENLDIRAFANNFNSGKYQREPEFIVGSGAYKLKEWKLYESITLERKKKWWGDKVKNAPLMKAYPTTIVYKVVPDQTVAWVMLKSEDLDVITGIKPQEFVALKEDKTATDKLYLETPNQFSYLYLGFNTKNTKLNDVRVRRALAHLIDRDYIIDALYQGLAVKTNCPISPSKSYYNKSLADIELSTEKAAKLLDEAGWKDSNGDGIRDKMIDGERVELKLTYKYNQGNPIRKNIGLHLQEEAKLVGIEIEVVPREWTVYLEDIKRRDFEIMSLAWVQGPGLDDLKQIWHTTNDTPDGSNRVGFGTAESDKLIDQIRTTTDEKNRNELYLELQKMIYDAQPYVFICAPMERVAISRRFKQPITSSLRPSYCPHLMQLAK
jgi:peptide/nickel transport system substrate-binding protein